VSGGGGGGRHAPFRIPDRGPGKTRWRRFRAWADCEGLEPPANTTARALCASRPAGLFVGELARPRGVRLVRPLRPTPSLPRPLHPRATGAPRQKGVRTAGLVAGLAHLRRRNVGLDGVLAQRCELREVLFRGSHTTPATAGPSRAGVAGSDPARRASRSRLVLAILRGRPSPPRGRRSCGRGSPIPSPSRLWRLFARGSAGTGACPPGERGFQDRRRCSRTTTTTAEPLLLGLAKRSGNRWMDCAGHPTSTRRPRDWRRGNGLTDVLPLRPRCKPGPSHHDTPPVYGNHVSWNSGDPRAAGARGGSG